MGQADGSTRNTLGRWRRHLPHASVDSGGEVGVGQDDVGALPPSSRLIFLTEAAELVSPPPGPRLPGTCRHVDLGVPDQVFTDVRSGADDDVVHAGGNACCSGDLGE